MSILKKLGTINSITPYHKLGRSFVPLNGTTGDVLYKLGKQLSAGRLKTSSTRFKDWFIADHESEGTDTSLTRSGVSFNPNTLLKHQKRNYNDIANLGSNEYGESSAYYNYNRHLNITETSFHGTDNTVYSQRNRYETGTLTGNANSNLNTKFNFVSGCDIRDKRHTLYIRPFISGMGGQHSNNLDRFY